MGESAQAESDPIRGGSSRSGPVRAAVDRLLRDRTGRRTIRDAMKALEVQQLVPALLAQRYADAVDRAARADDDVRLIAAGEKLRGMLGALEAADAIKPGGGTPDDGSTGPNGRVRELFSGSPTLGDAANG